MAEAEATKAQVEEDLEGHVWVKRSLVTPQDSRGMYDLWACELCQKKYRRRGLTWNPPTTKCKVAKERLKVAQAKEEGEAEDAPVLVGEGTAPVVKDEAYKEALDALRRTEAEEIETRAFARHNRGLVIMGYIQGHPEVSVTGAIKSFADDLGKGSSWTEFYNGYRAAERWPSEEDFRAFFNELKEANQLSYVSWRYICTNVLPAQDEDTQKADGFHKGEMDVAALEEEVERVEGRLERYKRRHADKEEIQEQLQSLELKLSENREELVRLRAEADASERPEEGPDVEKEELRARVTAYQTWLREHESCACCGDTELELAHWPRSKGAGAPDYDVIPLCREHHQELHDIGVGSFTLKHLGELFVCLCGIIPVRNRLMDL